MTEMLNVESAIHSAPNVTTILTPEIRNLNKEIVTYVSIKFSYNSLHQSIAVEKLLKNRKVQSLKNTQQNYANLVGYMEQCISAKGLQYIQRG